MKLLLALLLFASSARAIAPGTVFLLCFDGQNLANCGGSLGGSLVMGGTLPFVTTPVSCGTYATGPYTDANYISGTAALNAAMAAATRWTFEACLRTTAITVAPVILSTDLTGGMILQVNANGSMRLVQASGTLTTATSLWANNVYHYVQVEWNGTNRTIYLDGVNVATDTNSGAWPAAAGRTMHIGNYEPVATFVWTGYMQDVRFSNIARGGRPANDAAGERSPIWVNRQRNRSNPWTLPGIGR